MWDYHKWFTVAFFCTVLTKVSWSGTTIVYDSSSASVPFHYFKHSPTPITTGAVHSLLLMRSLIPEGGRCILVWYHSCNHSILSYSAKSAALDRGWTLDGIAIIFRHTQTRKGCVQEQELIGCPHHWKAQDLAFLSICMNRSDCLRKHNSFHHGCTHICIGQCSLQTIWNKIPDKADECYGFCLQPSF